MVYSKYHQIRTVDQRNKYKQEFNQEYEEYRNLHKNVEKVTRKFADLEVRMRQTPQGTEEFEVYNDVIDYKFLVSYLAIYTLLQIFIHFLDIIS